MKRGLCVIALSMVAAAWAAAQHVPIFPQGEVELQSRAQLVAQVGSWDVLAELLGRLWDEGTPLRSFESVTLGGYYRVLPNLKLGALYRLQAGARHDNDVIANLSTNQWDWNDTSGRLENILMLDASPRFLLDFLPGRDWVFMLKSRFLYNASYENQMSVLARPELTWFWIQDRVPLLNVSLSWELYFPLNFGSTLIYESYPYVTLLYHATPEIGIELAGAYKTTVWSTSTSWTAAGWDPYSTPVSSWVFSLGIVYTPSF
jgi:hypothetical protein